MRLCIEVVPLAAHNPAKGNHFSGQHAPFKVRIGAEIMAAILFLDLLCCFQSTGPDFRVALFLTVFNALTHCLVPFVPDLVIE